MRPLPVEYFQSESLSRFGAATEETWHSSSFPMPPHIWEQYLRNNLQRQRLKWALNGTDGDTAPSSKREMPSVLDTCNPPLSCFQNVYPSLDSLESKRRGPRANSLIDRHLINVLAIPVPSIPIRASCGFDCTRKSHPVEIELVIAMKFYSQRQDRSTRVFTERSRRVP